MAKARLISSSIFDDTWYGPLGFFEQQLWIGLFAKCADDQGRLPDNAFIIRAALFPYKDVAIADLNAALAEFAESGKIIRYEVDGKALIQLANWWEHQRPAWASASEYPAPDGWGDRIRTRQNGRYVETNWKPCEEPTVEAAGSTEHHANTMRTPSEPSHGVQVLTPTPVPTPTVNTNPVTEVCAATPPPAPEPEVNPHSEPPEKPKRRGNGRSAIAQLYHTVMGAYPNAVQETEIAATVTDTELFATCMKAWRLKGYAPTNVPGVLDWYKRGGPPANGHARDRPPPIQAPTAEKVYVDMPGFNVGNARPREKADAEPVR